MKQRKTKKYNCKKRKYQKDNRETNRKTTEKPTESEEIK
jgi:hypothetical protein